MELYIHIPFCKRKCRYCDFASYAGCESQMESYVDALLIEAQTQHSLVTDAEIETCFIGGGTPSLIPPEPWDRLLSGLHRIFRFSPQCEFTSEANPGTLTPAWLQVSVRHGINRLSLGVQAYQPSLLDMLGRIHTWEDAVRSVQMAREAGIHNLNLDLIFGLPGQTRQDWTETLDQALRLSPEHLSCYGLIPEDGTPLKQALDDGLLVLPDEDIERAMYDDTLRILASRGYEQYEISNFARQGHACRHNLGYWRQTPYLGLGVSAASMLPGDDSCYCIRKTNTASLAEYITRVTATGTAPCDTEHISFAEARFETMMLALRTTEGISEERFAAMHSISLQDCYGVTLHSLQTRGLMQYHNGAWSLTRRGMDIQNSVLVEFMEE